MSKKTNKARLLSRFQGCLLGGAVGDALGYPVEFIRDANAIARRLGPPSSARFPFPAPALVSDDTQMTLFVAEGVIRGIIRLADRGICSMAGVQQHALMRWLSTQGVRVEKQLLDGWLVKQKRLHVRRAPGNTCLSALSTLVARPELEPTSTSPINDSKGCGAVMRSAPIGLAAGTREAAFDLGRNAGVLTHGHPSGYLSAAYVASVIHDVARGTSLDDAMGEADALLAREGGHEELAAILTRVRGAARKGTPTVATIEALGGGWTGEEALGIALLCALTAERTTGGIASALWRSVVHGGDSDSTGSITGNLLGAMYGVGSLPRSWVRSIELREIVVRVAKDLFAVSVAGSELSFDDYPPW